MKALYNDVLVPTVFKPIAVTILIETQAEYDAIIFAKRNLTVCEIDSDYDEDNRQVWVDLLDCIADDMRGEI
jgi:hypothetical protein